jgi:hypothetical protein
MTGPQAGIERRIFGAIEAVPSRIPVVLGGNGSGRTSMVERLRDRLGRGVAQYIDVERSATTPERFLQAVTTTSPFPWHPGEQPPATPRESFDALLGLFTTARAPGGEPATFILDEVLELKTFENFPGLRHVVRELLAALDASPNRFVLTTRYVARARRILRDATRRYEVISVPPLAPADVSDMLAPAFNGYERMAVEDRDQLGRAVQALTDGRMSYVAHIAAGLASAQGKATDPVSTLIALLSPGAALDRECRFTYELRLHRARGYGALKAILDILAAEEPLTLTEISIRLHRTPGSTKDYLSWLEDVDLVASRQKKYSFTDPLLRLWVRLHCRPVRPSEEDLVREVQSYTAARVPLREQAVPQEAAPTLAYAGAGAEDRKNWGIIEID